MQLPAIRPLSARAGAVCALAATIVLSLLAPRAEAAVTPIASGALDWGVKASFRAYVVSSIAHGSITTAGGATANPDGTFRFPLTGGAFDDATNTTIAAFGGSVRFAGHDGQLDMTISDVRVELAPDGTRLLADISSVPFPSGGEPVSYPDVELLRLDLAGIDPAVGGGATRWPAIPGTLTGAGAPAFGSFYTAGTAFDPVAFAYAGPGGEPVAEPWSRPGALAFADDAETTDVDGILFRLFVDETRGVVHVVTTDGVAAHDLTTLEQLASVDSPGPLSQWTTAFDPETGTVFAELETGATDVLSYRYDAGAGAYVGGTVALSPYGSLDYDPATDTLWAIDSWNPDPAVERATRDGGGWDVDTSYPALDTDGRSIYGLARASGGELIATYYPDTVVHGISAIRDTGSALVASDIPGTIADTAFGTPQGYLNVAAAPAGGRVLATENSPLVSSKRTLTLTPSGSDPSGYAVAGAPLATGPDLSWFAFDRAADWQYGWFSDRVDVYSGGEVAGSFPATGTTLEAGSRAVYLGDTGAGSLTRWAHVGAAPTITGQPADASVTVPSAAATSAVQFAAAATGTPAPTVRWQRRAPGATAWTDVPGATSPTLQLEATTGLAGTRYRAVFESAAGSVASAAATLSVSVVPPRAGPPIVDPPAPPAPPSPPAGPPAGGATAAGPPLLDASRRRATVGRAGRATLATLRCRTASGAGACHVAAPRRVRIRIDGAAFWARVLKPATLGAGKRGAIRVQLGRAARRALAGRTTTVRLQVAIRSGRQRTAKHLVVALGRP